MFYTQSVFGPVAKYDLSIDQPLYKYARENKPSGAMSFTVWFGIVIWIIDGAGDECIAAYYNGCNDSYTHVHRHKIHYSLSGRAYIRKGGSRYYLDDFMRI